MGFMVIFTLSCNTSSNEEVAPDIDPTPIPIPENAIVFNVQKAIAPKNGKIGFLSSIQINAPHDEFILPLKPYIWRVGRANDAFSLYDRLKGLNVEKQLLILSDFRNTAPTSDIFEMHGYGALADSMASRAYRLGFDYEWDIYNEPNELMKEDLGKFMEEYWNPAYNAIRAKFPEAKVHGPSLTINNFENPALDSALVYRFIDAAIASNTLPDYINWHFQIGYNITDWHGGYAKAIKEYLALKGQTVLGYVAGETVRPGDERNTSPAVLVDVFAAQEIHDVTQIHAAWTSQPVYGVATSNPPVLDGLLANIDGTGKRGAWWTYEFFGKVSGMRIACENQLSGSKDLVGLAFRDDDQKIIRAMIGGRDPLGNQKNKTFQLTNLNALTGLVNNGKVHVKIWYNYQTKDAVADYGDPFLPLIMNKELIVEDNKIDIPININQWDALLIEVSAIKQ